MRRKQKAKWAEPSLAFALTQKHSARNAKMKIEHRISERKPLDARRPTEPDTSRLSRQAVGLAEILRSETLDEAARQSVLRILVAISRRQRNGGAS